MNGPYNGGHSGPHHRGFGPDPLAFGLWDAMGNLREMFGQRPFPRMGRGDVRAAILALLSEEPMHGYQIIHEIGERSGGAWKPSPGSVYPTLQMLADEGLVDASESDGKKTYALTETGQEQAAAAEGPAPWESSAARDAGHASALPKAGGKLAQAAMQVGRNGTPEQIAEAVGVLDDARRKLYAILAQD